MYLDFELDFLRLQISKLPPSHLQILRGSFSVVSTPIFAHYSIFVGNLLKRSTRFTYFCSKVQQMFVQNVLLFFQSSCPAKIANFTLNFDECVSELRRLIFLEKLNAGIFCSENLENLEFELLQI